MSPYLLMLMTKGREGKGRGQLLFYFLSITDGDFMIWRRDEETTASYDEHYLFSWCRMVGLAFKTSQIINKNQKETQYQAEAEADSIFGPHISHIHAAAAPTASHEQRMEVHIFLDNKSNA